MQPSGYRFTTANDTQGNPGRNPVTWSLFGSNSQSEISNDAVWTLLDHRENDTTLGATNYTPYDFFIPELIIPGDVNDDDVVDDVDLVVLKRHIIGKSVDKFVFEAADLNMDGKINAQDVVTLINMLMTEF